MLNSVKSAVRTHFEFLILICFGAVMLCIGFCYGEHYSARQHQKTPAVAAALVENPSDQQSMVYIGQLPGAVSEEDFRPITQMVEGVMVETYPRNSEMKMFHLRKYVGHENFSFTRSRKATDPVFDDTEVDRDLIAALLDMEGVEEISVHEYEVRVTKGKAFVWQEVQPKVVAILKAFQAEAFDDNSI